MSQEPYRNRPYLVPKAPFRRVIREYLARMDRIGEDSEQTKRFGDSEAPLTRDAQVALLIWGVDNGRDVDKSCNMLWQFLREDNGYWTNFDIADRIVVRLIGPMQWLCDPELSAIYESANLAALDICHPTCEAAELEAVTEMANMPIVEACERYGVSDHVVKNARKRYRELTEAAA